ncbi:unnamed protein product [Symbiodinium natans]|uniref:Uncharacterized protein n=1 Tax=Symbiodinium natans TaxID=878477 RepID=A0A812PJB8_9DINO|nr:unnamed protein product [Symbiodinium natans]
MRLTDDEVQECVFVNNWYVCRDDVEVIEGYLQFESGDPGLAMDHTSALQHAARRTLASIIGDSMNPDAIKTTLTMGPSVQIEAPERRLAPLTMEVSIFLISPDLSRDEIEQGFSAYSLDNLSALFVSTLAELSVDVAAMGISVSGIAIPFASRPPAS